MLRDSRIFVSSYKDLLKSVTTPGAYSEMMHIYAMSSCIQNPIRSYFPPQLAMEYLSEPFSRKVVGRRVNQSSPPISTLMWTQALPVVDKFEPNHFVALLPKYNSEIVSVDLSECKSQSNSNSLDTCHVPDLSESDIRTQSDSQQLNTSDSFCETETHSNSLQSKHDMLDLSNEMSTTNDEIFHVNDSKDANISDLDNSHVSVESSNDTNPHFETRYGDLANDFLPFDDLMFIFDNPDKSKIIEKIPQGKKENVIFLVENENKISDDCGIWNSASGASPKTSYLKMPDDSLKTVFVKKGEYHTRKKNKGKTNFVKLDPQPSDSQIVEIKRYYATSKKDKMYKRRITSQTNKNFSIVEYLGKFPGLSSHGNSKNHDRVCKDTD